MTAVVDTSPLISLAHLDLLHLLPKVFGRTLAPPGVVREATERRASAPGATAIRAALESGLLELAAPGAPDGTSPEWLGPGEREAMAVALAERANWVVIDDRRARRYAVDLGLKVIGTVRVLEVARAAGHIERAGPLLEQLRNRGFRLGEGIVARVRDAEGGPAE